MRPSQTILVLEDLGNSFQGPLYRKGIRLRPNDGQTVKEVYQQWWLLTIDLGYLTLDDVGKNIVQQAFTEMMKADVLDLNNAFAELLHLVRCKRFTGFKALCKRINSHLHHMVKGDFELMALGDVFAARRLVQLFSYTSRLSLKEINLTQQCLDEYLDIESKISNVFPEPIVASLNTIIKGWFQSFDPTRFRFQHGPGGVAGHGRTSLEFKYKDLNTDYFLQYAFGSPTWLAEDERSLPVQSSLDRISQTIFVPKSYKTFRTISMEPATLMYLQQGVWGEIDRVVASTPFLRARIGFHEQERNQRLARQGSLERNYATIDLSAASDSVSHALVKRIFQGTKLLRYLLATRSRQTLLPDGRLVTLKKFAPMGSALCFPVETILFAAICQYVTKGYGMSGDYSVFGDDIIVPTRCAESVMTVLTVLGFTANRSKSFFESSTWFRESCGGEYIDGLDVTPMRVSRSYQHDQQLVQTIGLVELANEAHRRGFLNLRAFFLRKLKSYGFKPVFSPTGIHSENSTNFHLRSRWNQDLQRNEVKASALISKSASGTDESIRLRHWLESNSDRLSVEEAFVSKIGRPTVQLKDRWLAPNHEQLDQYIVTRML